MKLRALTLALFAAGCGGEDTAVKDGMPVVSASATATATATSSSVTASQSATASSIASASVPVVATTSAAPSASKRCVSGSPETLLGTVKIKSIQAAWAANSDKVADRMILGFRRCYSKGLASDPTAAGDVRVQANIGANGEVISTKILKPSKLSPDVESCMATRVSTALFAPPPAAPGFLKVTIHCEPK